MAKQKRDRRSFTEEFKQQLLAEIEGGRKLIDVAKENGLQPSQLSLWRKKQGGGRSAKKAAKAARPDAPKAAAKRSASPAAASAPAEAAPSSSAPASTPAPAPRAENGSQKEAGIGELEHMIVKLVIENDRLRREIEALRSR